MFDSHPPCAPENSTPPPEDIPAPLLQHLSRKHPAAVFQRLCALLLAHPNNPNVLAGVLLYEGQSPANPFVSPSDDEYSDETEQAHYRWAIENHAAEEEDEATESEDEGDAGGEVA